MSEQNERSVTKDQRHPVGGNLGNSLNDFAPFSGGEADHLTGDDGSEEPVHS